MRVLAAAVLILLVNGPPEEPGISGYVLASDGTPVSGGTAIAQSGTASRSSPIDDGGRFRVVPPRAGVCRLVVSVPGLTPYRLDVDVPPSTIVRLPVIRLAAGAYFRARFVSPSGEPIMAPQLRRRLFDVAGRPMFEELGERFAESAASDGTTTLGPLPRGIVALALDMPFFARTRLADVPVGETTTVVDGGTIVIAQPGVVLHVDVLDGAGAPVANHDVFLADTRPRSPLAFAPTRTDRDGRATFDRLAPGRYRVSAPAAGRCGNVRLTASRVVAVADSGAVGAAIVVGGRAAFRITSSLGPASGVVVTATPNVPPISPPFGVRPPASGCSAATDSNGRVALTNFPPGPAHVDVRMANSTYVRQIEVPSDGREVAVAIPDGFLPVRVVSAITGEPVAGATVAWTGGGGRVEASPTASGDALLEGVGAGAGTLAASAPGYQKVEEQLAEPPAILHTIALAPLMPVAPLRVRVLSTSGEPLPEAIVELAPANAADVPRVVLTGAKGAAAFPGAPSGAPQLIASADGFVTSAVRVGENRRREVVFALTRGYRLIADVELPPASGPQVVTVANDAGASMDALLDSRSSRRIDPPGRLSLGPLAPGAYAIQLNGAGRRRTARLRIVDRDEHATIR